MEINISGKSYIQRLGGVYSILYEKTYGIKPTPNYAQWGKVFKTLSEFYSEYQIAYFLIQYFDCAGMDDNDKQFITNKTHSIFFFTAKIDSIRAHSKNVLGIDTDDEEQIISIVNKTL